MNEKKFLKKVGKTINEYKLLQASDVVAVGLSGGKSTHEIDLVRAQTMVFNFVVLYELILVFVIRQGYQVPWLSNIWVWASVVLSILLLPAFMEIAMNL